MPTNNPSDCPYKGLQPYTEEDREYFFGRERDRETVASNLFAAPLTILYGSSGVGKSSILQAGAIPQLRENPRLIVVLFGSWQGDGFDRALKSAVLSAVCENTGKSPDEVLQRANKVLETKTARTLEELSFDDLLIGCVRGCGRRILMIFDQFEEYFLYHAPTSGAAGFDAEFARAVNQQDSGVNFMLAMREEELSKLDRFRARIPTLLSNLLRLDHLDQEAAVNAIRKPLDVYNKKHPHATMTIKDDLVAEVINQVRPRHFAEEDDGQLPTNAPLSAAHYDSNIETPFLQMVLVGLWEEEKARGSSELRLSTLDELGGAKQIARTHLDKVMEQLSDSERDIAASVLRFLVTPKGSKIALDPPTLAGFANLKEEDVSSVLTLLSLGKEMRILRKVTVPGQTGRYELFHDVLGPAILDWRARYLQTQQLAQQRAEAERKLSHERRKSNRLRLVLAGIAILLLLMTGLTVFAFRQQAEAKRQQGYAATSLKVAQDAQADLEREKKKVEVERDNAKSKEQIADQARKDAEVAQHSAEEEKIRADQQAASAERAKAQAIRAAKTDEWIRLALDETRAGNIDNAINNFQEARKLYHDSKDASGEAAALFNVGESNATKAAVLSLQTLKLFSDLGEGIESGANSEQLTSYMIQFQYLQAIKSSSQKRQNEVRTALRQATSSYTDAIAITKTQAERGNPEALVREALMLRRIGDVSLSEALFKSDKPDLDGVQAVFDFYERASVDYQKAGKHDEAGILLSTMGFLAKQLAQEKKTDDGGATKDDPRVADYYGRAKEAYQQAGNNASEGVMNLRLAELYEAKDKAKAFQSYEQARRAFRSARLQTRDSEEQGSLRQRETAILTTIGRVKDKQELTGYYDSVIADYRDDPATLASALVVIAEVFDNQLKDKDSAINYYTKARQASSDAHDNLQEGKSLLRLGEIYLAQGNQQKAIESFDGVRAAYARIQGLDKSSREGLVGDLISIGNSYADKNEPGRAIMTFSQALSLYQEAEPDTSYNYRIAQMIDVAARTLIKLKDPEITSSFFKSAFTYFEKMKDPGGETQTLSLAGDVYSEQGKKQEAFAYYEKARAQTQKNNNNGYLEFALLTKIAKLFVADKNDTGAISYFEGVVESYQKAKNSGGEARVLESAGDTLKEMGKQPQAIEYYKRSILTDLKAGTEFPPPLLTKLSKVLGTDAAATPFYEEVISLSKTVKNVYCAGNTLKLLGFLFNQAGQTEQAIAYYGRAVLAFPMDSSGRMERANSLRAISSIYKTLGNQIKADDFSRQADELVKQPGP